MNGIGTGIDAIPNGMSSKFPLHGALTNGAITLIRRLLAARDLTTFTIIADFYTVELILYRNMCSHFETGFAPNPFPILTNQNILRLKVKNRFLTLF